MFLDIAPSEFLLTAIVAVVVIGPKDLPRAMRTAGKWMGKMRKISGHFRSGLETMIREAELEEMEKKWREQNEAIMKANPPAVAALPAEVTAVAPSEPLAPGEVGAAHEGAAAAVPAHSAAPLDGVPVDHEAHPAPTTVKPEILS
jgi:sec-independent protein translocase protein TatB